MNEAVSTWVAILERIEQSLAAALARSPEVPPVMPRGAAADDPLVRLSQRFEQWRAGLERAERAAGGPEGDLDADEKAVAEWLAAAAVARQRLAGRAHNGA